MPKLLFARAPVDEKEERQIRKLAGSRPAPAEWMTRARMLVGSWEGKRTTAIAAQLGCPINRRCYLRVNVYAGPSRFRVGNPQSPNRRAELL